MASLSRRACYKCGNVGHYAVRLGVGHRWAQVVEDLVLVEDTGVVSVVDGPELLEDRVQPLVTSVVDQIIMLETAKLKR
ncbi:MAG: hypothetical protein Q9172_006072 [Xanthocarpia lactea]